jgi:hypothetical protein
MTRTVAKMRAALLGFGVISFPYGASLAGASTRGSVRKL